MSSIVGQWFTPFVTVIGGVIIFVVGQAVLKLLIEPVQHLKAAVGNVANTLLRQQAKITNGLEDADLSAKMFDHAAELVSKAEVVVFYKSAKSIFGLPSKAHILEAARELNAIGNEARDKRPSGAHSHSPPNGLAAVRNHESIKRIAGLLRIKADYK
ncbi:MULTISPECIES: hypothetical protein [Pseudomonas]|uniref:Uncharacterized protein n=1 Tax=Pseudomonas quercus TaxID=2722792 RepID=A0ABX0YAB8_9PSED|nr:MULTISPECIES: hypothetical protein [Pseudomonas]MBF7141437.1 hypothetical protein [Pseudomonas sp. LY10J]NJO99975.1 hypothetical protein [Pseudomonas quercus]